MSASVPIPQREDMAAYTAAVFANDDWRKLDRPACRRCVR
jgi:hypothetical protein